MTCSSPFQQPLHILKLPPACSATPRHFHLPPHYEDDMVTLYVSLDKGNLNAVNISTTDFHIWQHLGSNWTTDHMQKLVDILQIHITQLHKHMIGQSAPVLPFEINTDMEEGPFLTWKLLTNPGTYIVTIDMVLLVYIGIYCLKRFWCRSSMLRCQPYFPISL